MKSDAAEKEKIVENEIASFFHSDNILITNTVKSDNWSLPKKLQSDYKSLIVYSDRIYEEISSGIKDEVYDTSGLVKILSTIDNVLSNKIPQKAFQKGVGFAYPNTDYNYEIFNHKQINSVPSCENFVKEVTSFKSDEIFMDTPRLSAYYLLGYVGSGKTTLLNYVKNKIKQDLVKNNIIPIYFEYNEISELLFEEDLKQVIWDKMIRNLLYRKMIQYAIERDYITEDEDVKYKLNPSVLIKRLLVKHHVLFIFDGFDSLSANKIEKKNSKRVLYAITKLAKKIKDIYQGRVEVNHYCKIIFSLRKCTYDSMIPAQRISRSNNNSYFLSASKFEEVIDATLEMLGDADFIKKDGEEIFRLIRKTSARIDLIYNSAKENEIIDVFDNNYRRRLRYISTVIVVFALRLSKEFSYKSKPTHKEFLEALIDTIEGDKVKDYLFHEILIFGLNTSYNNHFSQFNQEVNLGRECGFVDNIFCYFPSLLTKNKKELKNKFILKLRILQILHRTRKATDGNEKRIIYEYKSVIEIKEMLGEIGIYSSFEVIEFSLDFLEKSLYLRSSKKKTKASLKDRSETLRGRGISFKCTNFGANFINNILCSFSYLSGVTQNTCMPDKLSSKFKYQHKHLDATTASRFINHNWPIKIIPYSLIFLKVLKSIELRNEKDEHFHIWRDMSLNAQDVITRILSSDYKLTMQDKNKIKYDCEIASRY